MKRLLLSLCLSVGYLLGNTQTLSLQEAIEIALEKNYGILVAQNDAEVNANNVYPGAAGLLPFVDLSGGFTYNNNNTKVEFATPTIPSVDVSGAESNAYNAGININYTLFNGGQNQNTYRVLQQSAQLSETQLEAVIEATISQVSNAYYQIARLTQNFETLGESLTISQDRIRRIRNQREFGGATQLAELSAEVDFNTDSANVAITHYNLENAKRSLNALMGREIETPFEVDTEVTFNDNLNLEALQESAQEQNTAMKLAEYNVRISELNEKIAQGRFAPVIGLTGGYNYNRADNGPGSILKTQENLGFTVGASLTFNLFSGNQRRVGRDNAAINTQSSQYQWEETWLNLQRDLSNAWYTYQSALTQLRLEEKSLESAEENFSRTEDAFQLGQGTNVQFREAQLNVQRVKDRLNDLRYTAKLNEIEVLRLSGMLLEEKP